MPAPYSYDLRKKVIEYLDSGRSVIEARKVFNISRKAIYEWKNLKKETGDIHAKSGYQNGHSHKVKDLQAFENFIKQNKDNTTKELAFKWGNISASTISNLIRKLNYSYKKNFSSSKKR